MNLEQRRREVRKHTQIRRTYNLDLEESTMARTRNKISKIANDSIFQICFQADDILVNTFELICKVPCKLCLVVLATILEIGLQNNLELSFSLKKRSQKTFCK